MIKGKTKSGFEYELTDEHLDDYEIMEVLSELREDRSAMVKAIRVILGADQEKRLKAHVKDKFGRVTTSQMSIEFDEIMRSSPVKNS